jgi:hypothetical protein
MRFYGIEAFHITVDFKNLVSPDRSDINLQATFFQQELGKSAHIFFQDGQIRQVADDDQVTVACRNACLTYDD